MPEQMEETTAPERIYLDWGDDPSGFDVSWCAHPINDNDDDQPDVEYVRADVIESYINEVRRLRKALGHYADEKTWRRTPRDGWINRHYIAKEQHGYRVARQALSPTPATQGNRSK